jgi:hypothetical protein
MNRTRRYRILAVVGALSIAGLTLGTTVPASAKTKAPSMKYTPKSKLGNGSVVEVTGKNFPVGAQLYVVQCVTADQSLTGGGCNIDGAQGPETVGSNGSWGPVALTLKTGQIGTDPGTCGTTKTDAKACSVSVGTASGTDSLQVPIKFTIPKTKK